MGEQTKSSGLGPRAACFLHPFLHSLGDTCRHSHSFQACDYHPPSQKSIFRPNPMASLCHWSSSSREHQHLLENLFTHAFVHDWVGLGICVPDKGPVISPICSAKASLWTQAKTSWCQERIMDLRKHCNIWVGETFSDSSRNGAMSNRQLFCCGNPVDPQGPLEGRGSVSHESNKVQAKMSLTDLFTIWLEIIRKLFTH